MALHSLYSRPMAFRLKILLLINLFLRTSNLLKIKSKVLACHVLLWQVRTSNVRTFMQALLLKDFSTCGFFDWPCGIRPKLIIGTEFVEASVIIFPD